MANDVKKLKQLLGILLRSHSQEIVHYDCPVGSDLQMMMCSHLRAFELSSLR